ncbi:hypothetical protein EMCRGX_G005756 [Ephydatia muelleri]
MMYNSSCREDEDIDLSEYLHDPTEYGLHFNTFTGKANYYGCYLQCGPLLQYWNMHMRPTPAFVVNLFTNEYLYLHHSDVDNLCEWVLNAREEYEKHAMFGKSAEVAVEHHEFEGTVTKHNSSSSMSKLCMDNIW